jgi:3-phenylpropionate/trans-cinnamate dioxygenase ferredoxin reductase subunit
LPFAADSDVFTMRSLDDSRRLAVACNELRAHATVAVIGGGFIGAEVATALHARDVRPVVIEAQDRPLQGILGNEVATWLEDLPRAAGIELRVNQQVDDVVRTDRGYLITTSDGSLTADLVVVGVGALPNVEWLDGSGLTLHRGLVVDEFLAAAPGVWGVGDVAVFPFRSAGETEHVRIEHWQIANDHASYVAKSIVAGPKEPFRTVPYFWSDQYGKKIQMLGHPRPSDDVVLMSGSPDEGKWLAHYRRDDVVTGVIALNNARELMLSRPLLENV